MVRIIYVVSLSVLSVFNIKKMIVEKFNEIIFVSNTVYCALPIESTINWMCVSKSQAVF